MIAHHARQSRPTVLPNCARPLYDVCLGAARAMAQTTGQDSAERGSRSTRKGRPIMYTHRLYADRIEYLAVALVR